MQRILASLVIAACFGVSGCTPHSDPMASWRRLSTFSDSAIPDTIKQDARAFFQTLPKVEKDISEDDYEVTYWENGTGQHAVILHAPHDSEYWNYALIYDQDNRRIKVLKYSTGSYGITDASRYSGTLLAQA